MIIIVEGIDRVGKTTLINKLAESCDIRPFVDSYLKFNYLNYVTDTLMTVEGNRNDIIANTEKKAKKELERDDLDDKSEELLRDMLSYVDKYRSVEPSTESKKEI